jgi:hypothetical protein
MSAHDQAGDTGKEVLPALPFAAPACQHDAWIAANKELPAEFERVLLLKDCGKGTLESMSVGYVTEGQWWIDHTSKPLSGLGYRATHWMPLPPLPNPSNVPVPRVGGHGEQE